ncbi:MAG: hypothetical protein ACRDY1_01025 [Acidimicrobiales bacterium]
MTEDRARRRAARLSLLYPPAWRRQFPDFVGVVASELSENRRGVIADVMRCAALERLRTTGIIGRGPADGAGSGLAMIYAVLVPSTALAIGMWSQLHTGLVGHGTPPSANLRGPALLLLIGAVGGVLCLPVGIVVAAATVRPGSHLTKSVPSALVFLFALTGLSLLGMGADHSGWYTPAAQALPAHGLGHAGTLWVRGLVAAITPAWIHPGLLMRMPPGELVAVLLAPATGLVAAGALFRMVSTLAPCPLRRLDVAAGVTGAATMVLAVGASVRWILTHPTRQGFTAGQAHTDGLAPGHTGWAVVALMVVLASAALCGLRRLIGGRAGPAPGVADVDLRSSAGGADSRPASSLLLADR